MTVLEMALKYYPRLWSKDRIEALVAAERLTEEEAAQVYATESTESATYAE